MRLIAAAAFLLMLSTLAQAQNAFLRQDRIYSGDIAELTIIHDATIPSMYSVDTTPLQAEFDVLDSEARVFRFKQDNNSVHRMEWRARLLPRRNGRIEVPSLQFGSHRSNPLTLTVEPIPPELNARQRVFVEIEAQPVNPYPGQQTRILYRLFHNLALSGGSLREPDAEQAQVFRSGRERRYQEDRDGDSFSVLERSVLLLPMAATKLKVKPAQISTGLPVTEQDRIHLQDDIRYVHRKSPQLELVLRDLPAAMDIRNWLPAEQLELSVDWTERPTSLEPGDTLELILSIHARGLAADALPSDLLLRASEYFTVYADQATRQTRVMGLPGEEYLVGILRQRYAVLIERTGETSLPALHLDWWDTNSDRAQVARIESQALTIGNPGSTGHAGQDASLLAIGNSDQQQGAFTFHMANWPAIVAAIVCLALFFPAVRLLRRRASSLWLQLTDLRLRRRRLSQLRHACQTNDPIAARVLLLDWSRKHWSDERLNGLRQVVEITASEEWATTVKCLDAAVYAADPGIWQGRELWRLVKQQTRRGSRESSPKLARLPGPYPPPAPRAGTSPQPV